jgi:hypothetical protein
VRLHLRRLSHQNWCGMPTMPEALALNDWTKHIRKIRIAKKKIGVCSRPRLDYGVGNLED